MNKKANNKRNQYNRSRATINNTVPSLSKQKDNKSTTQQDRDILRIVNYLKLYNYYLIILYFFYVYLGISLKNDPVRLAFDITILLFLFGALIIETIRKRYYMPGISEMKDSLYWPAISIIQITLHSLFFFIKGTSSTWDQVNLSVTVILILVILSAYQTKFWTFEDASKRQDRIYQLCKKAKLTGDEYRALQPILIAKHQEGEKTPRIWQIFKVSIAFVIALLINTYAGPLLEVLRPLGLPQ